MTDRQNRFYLALEERFRGSPSLILERQRVWLPLIQRSRAHVSANPSACFLDIGCGRGEWLTLLRDQGVACKGLDMNPEMVALCRQAGHDAICADALTYLRSLPDQSLSGVSAFHVVEHLDHETALDLLAEIHRCVIDAGVVIFETPNPENLRTATLNFYIDPTHLRPIPPVLLQFMFEFSGFNGNEIVRLNPEGSHKKRWRLARILSRSLMRRYKQAQDYAVVGVKGPVPADLLPAIRAVT